MAEENVKTNQRINVSMGLEYQTCYQISEQIEDLGQLSLDFAVLPIVHTRSKRYPDVERYHKFTMSEDSLEHLRSFFSDWRTLIVPKVNCQYKDIESKNYEIRLHAEDLLNQELDYCTYIGFGVIMISLENSIFTNLARTLYSNWLKNNALTVWLRVPMKAPNVNIYRKDIKDVCEDTWTWWNKFRSMVNIPKLCIALEVSEDICTDEELNRWLGEPLKCIIISTKIFQTNKRGYPTLNNTLDNFLKRAMDMNLQIIITGINRHVSYLHYVQYMHRLKQMTTTRDPLVIAAQQYEDYLQYPLQPLAHNLGSLTYECFEKDPIKYKLYQQAIFEALLDRVPEDKADSVTTVIMVVGAGRGPLVSASLAAAKDARRKVKVYAVEKNVNAVVGLMHLRDTTWSKHDVTIVSIDMREWNPPSKGDIMVSELLGSFGDNELSPECLYKAQYYLKEDGISIPYRYTSYIAPMMSHKLYNEICKFSCEYKSPLFKFEQPYVVYQKNKYEIAEPQPLFTFEHPYKNEDEIELKRYDKLTFKSKQDCVLHGIAGYFDTFLYKDIMLSIHPKTYSTGLISWFPVLFPICKPINVKAGGNIEVHFWRCHDKINVWYEWLVSEPVHLPIHNINGCSYKMSMCI